MRSKAVWLLAGIVAATLLIAAPLPIASADEKLININTASVEELVELKGIGDAKAKAIVEYREKSGPFKSVDDLQNVKGIGDKLLAKLRPQLSVGAGSQAASGAPAAPAGVAPAAASKR